MAKPAKDKTPPVRPVKIISGRGDWTAEVDGERLAVIHDTWWTGKGAYRDPMVGVNVKAPRYVEYVETLEATDRVVVQRDKGNGNLDRESFVGVFSFADLLVDPAGPVQLRLTRRVANARK